MNFDYTYIILFDRIVFEPLILVSNFIIFAICVFAFLKFNSGQNKLANQWARFFIYIGTGSVVGAVAHAVHYQLGSAFLSNCVFILNALSLLAIYHCYRAANIYYWQDKEAKSKLVTWGVLLWIAILLVITFIQRNFVLIKVHAGIVLTYSLIVHLITYKRKGSAMIAWGIIVSFPSIIVHSAKFSFHEWFNYKDISHVIMIISLVMLYKGVKEKTGIETERVAA